MGFLGGAMFGLAVSMMTASVRTGSVLGQTHFTRSRLPIEQIMTAAGFGALGAWISSAVKKSEWRVYDAENERERTARFFENPPPRRPL
ncbi:Uncharacterized protein PBTT_06608 [Plasmodiophora brassicae]